MIAQIANIMAGRKDGPPWTAAEFMIKFKEPGEEVPEHQGQSLQQIENSIKTWVAAANIMARRELKMGPKAAN